VLIVEHLVTGLKDLCGAFPDKRKSEGVYSMADIGMSAFSLFFMQSESFLEYQRALEERQATSNCHSLFGMTRIPTDNHIRAMLDPVHPSYLQGAFDAALATLEDHGGLEPFQRLGGRCLIALDGTEYFCSQKLGCPNCQTRKRSNGKVESYHSMLAASLVAPGHARVLPLMPEFIARPDGVEKQDCERNAVKRWLAAHGARLQHLRPVYLGDDLFACQPIAEAMIQAGGDFLLTAKPASHKALYDFIAGATAEEYTRREVLGGKLRRHHLQWFNQVPLRDGKDALLVNWIGLTITDAKGKITYQGAFVTNLPVNKTNVAEIADCARARWKVENETLNVLKNNGYHLEHNFGHGKQNLAMMFAAMNLLAFAFHTVCDTIDTLWIRARQAKKTRRRFFEHLRSITAYLVFPSWDVFLNTLITSKPPPQIAPQIDR
jgi:hypothetical protein